MQANQKHMATTLILWRVLKSPAREHPAFIWASRQPVRRGGISLWIVLCVVGFYVLLSMVVGNNVPPGSRAALTAFALMLPLGLLLFIFSGTAYGAIWSMRISHTLLTAHNTGLYDLIATSPDGGQGASWAVAKGCLHRDKLFERIPDAEAPIQSRTVLVILAAIVGLMFTTEQGRAAVIPIVLMLMVLTALQIDYMQSAVLGALVGMLTPTFAGAEARTWALGLFLSLQVLAYLLVLIAVLVALPALYRLGPAWMSTYGLGGLPELLVFYAAREPMLRGLYGLLQHQLGEDMR